MNDKDIEEYYKKSGWNMMDTKDGHAWFGGKSHYSVAESLPKEATENCEFEDIDFLVVGWRKC